MKLPTIYNWARLLNVLEVGDEHSLPIIHRQAVASAITRKKDKKFVTRKTSDKNFIVRRVA